MPKNNSWYSGIFYALIPHSFCIAFILFSVIGAVSATAFLKKFMLIPHFFGFLMTASLVLATMSAIIYLKRSNCLCACGIKSKWKYITILYSTIIFVNYLMFYGIFPVLANAGANGEAVWQNYPAAISVAVKIPCSGHAPLIIDELKKEAGVGEITFKMPNIFDIKYDASKISPEKILSLNIFKQFEAEVK